MDGIAAIYTRMAEIRGTLAALAPERVGLPTATTAVAGESFATVLATEVAGQAAAGRLGPDGAPVELAAYGNGRVPAEALAPIGTTGHRLWAPATRAYEQLSAAAARDGVNLAITDSYRSYEGQVDVAARKGLYSQGGLAAAPGTSDHGWGRSLDLDLDATALAWMKVHAGTYGFVADTPRESWHWTYSPPV